MSDTAKAQYEWTLKWTNDYGDFTKFETELTKKLQEFALWRDSEAKFVTKEEFDELVKAEKVKPYKSKYTDWEIGQKGMICKSYYANQYQTTWDLIATCKSDWRDGFWACEQKLQKKLDFLIAWDEAIIECKVEMRKRRKAYLLAWEEAIIENWRYTL